MVTPGEGLTVFIQKQQPQLQFASESSDDGLQLASAGGGILARAERISDGIERLLDLRKNPFATIIEGMTGPVEATIRGRRTLLFGTNSYLGLNFHPDCIKAAVEATTKLGTGATASRVAGGTTREHIELERQICSLYERQHCWVFSTGFMANLGVVAGLGGRGDAIFMDAHCHASILDAAKMSGADVYTFRHNDAADLQRLFDTVAIAPSRALVVVEGLYSVQGDIGKLREILPLAKDRGAVTVVDEAHALGIYGRRGRGVAEFLEVEDYADVVVGTFSKSVGVIGGFCTTDIHQLRGFTLMARPYLYTAALPPAIVAAARRSLQVMSSNSKFRDSLWQNTEMLRARLAKIGVSITGKGPIGSIAIPRKDSFGLWDTILDRGIYVNLLIPPATPDREYSLRVSVSAAHKPEHIDQLIDTLDRVLNSAKVYGA